MSIMFLKDLENTQIVDHELVFNHEQFAVGMYNFLSCVPYVGRFTNVCLVLFLVTFPVYLSFFILTYRSP